ncbi:dynein regulatory complex protein 10 [Lucilia cuprina]|uniref:dynein regulatory complex protein 10 n=1 Tax=Lucilia cuprina TaxID=7375 RepID=UPI001F063CB1|nr:dynein regulatory complex protein 10 [Lucilia cuprina]
MFNKKIKPQKMQKLKQINSSQENEEISLERQTQINSIIRIMRESLDKLRISLILPQIFENFLTVQQRLRGSQYEMCIEWIKKYIQEKNMVAANNSPPHLNYHLIKIIDFFHENLQLFEYFHDFFNDLTTADKSLIDTFQLLLKITEDRLKKSAISELNKEKRIHEVYHENQSIQKNIKVFQNLLKSQRLNLKWKMAAKDGIIQKYEKDLATCKYENNIKIKQEIVRSSRLIGQIHASSVLKQKELEEELERIKISYEQLLKENLKQEKTARDEKNKLLLQLQALIKKFDQTMGDKIKENMFLQEEYERQKKSFEEFLIEYNREELEYEQIVRAKEEEEKRQHEQKILLFMMNRSARVIQKHWRKFRRAQKKAAKRGKSRGKSKKK